jgi:hypothetical protein
MSLCSLLHIVGANGRIISSPERAVFFHPLAKNLSFPRYYSLSSKHHISYA